MPPKRAAARRVPAIIAAAAGANRRRTRGVAAPPPVNAPPAPVNAPPAPGQAEAPLTAVLAELKQLAAKQEQLQQEVAAANAARQQDSLQLRAEMLQLQASGQQQPMVLDLEHAPVRPAASTQPEGSTAALNNPELQPELASYITGEREPFVPVDLHIDDKLKNRIWANEAIDMALLVKGGESVSVGLQITKSTQGSLVQIAEVPQKASFLSESQWLAAWNIFGAIYLQRHPGEAPKLAVHFQQVQKLMQLKADWRGYDTAIRRMIQQGRQRWGQHNPSIFTDARLKFITTQGFQAGGQNQRSRFPVPQGFCFAFGQNQKCLRRSCIFKHSCAHCGAPHATLTCGKGLEKKAGVPNQPFRGYAPGKNAK